MWFMVNVVADVTFLLLAYLRWALFRIISSRSSLFLLFNSSSWCKNVSVWVRNKKGRGKTNSHSCLSSRSPSALTLNHVLPFSGQSRWSSPAPLRSWCWRTEEQRRRELLLQPAAEPLPPASSSPRDLSASSGPHRWDSETCPKETCRCGSTLAIITCHGGAKAEREWFYICGC